MNEKLTLLHSVYDLLEKLKLTCFSAGCVSGRVSSEELALMLDALQKTCDNTEHAQIIIEKLIYIEEGKTIL